MQVFIRKMEVLSGKNVPSIISRIAKCFQDEQCGCLEEGEPPEAADRATGVCVCVCKWVGEVGLKILGQTGTLQSAFGCERSPGRQYRIGKPLSI